MPDDKTKGKTQKMTKRCGCGATVFQGPFQRGPIVDDLMVVREELYECVNCHAVRGKNEIEDVPLVKE